MGRTGIEFEDVVGAIELLQQQRLPVTQERIRLLLGAGSYSTIGKHLQRWRLGSANQMTSNPQEISQEVQLPDPILQVVQSIWLQLETTKQEEVHQIQEQAQEKIQIAESERHIAEEKLAELAQTTQDTIEQLQIKYAEIQQAFEQLERQHQTTLQDNEQLHVQLNHYRLELERTHTAHQQALVVMQQNHQSKEEGLQVKLDLLQQEHWQVISLHQDQIKTLKSALRATQLKQKKQRSRLILWLRHQRKHLHQQQQQNEVHQQHLRRLEQSYGQSLGVIGKLETERVMFQHQAHTLECMVAALRDDRD